MRVLVVEDDASLQATLRLGLKAAKFEVEAVSTCAEALERADRGSFTLAIVDVNLPDASGFSLVPRLKERGLLVVLLTARTEVADRVHGFEVGADDYIPKPFAFEELVARLHAVARRPTQLAARILRAGDVSVDLDRQVARRAGHVLDLTRRELELLTYFLRNPSRVLTHDQILDNVWGYESDVGKGALDVYVSYLRKKLEAYGPRIIHTVRGVGYILRTDDH